MRRIPIVPAVLIGLLLHGCASTSDLEGLRADVRKAEQTAESARQLADSAQNQAAAARAMAWVSLNLAVGFTQKLDESRVAALTASLRALQAQRAAEAATASAEETNERLERALKKSAKR